MTIPDQELMSQIRAKYRPFIAAAVEGTPIPESFLAALIANESGGNTQASRVEPAVLLALAEVAIGRKANYGAIGRQDLLEWCEPKGASSRAFADSLLALVNLATSWGLTQIMGYKALAEHFALSELMDLNRQLSHAVYDMADFCRRFAINNLPEQVAIEQLLRCWNTGRPDGKTFDPAYVPNGILRMRLYEELPA